MAFQQGLSGLNAASKALDVTSNNVSNSATVGFKSGQAHFADVYANSLNGSGTSQTGIGTTTTAVQQQFTQGNITTTSNSLDISINGSGFYRMDTNGAITYSRSGQFHLDKNGYVIDDQQRKLTGYLADSEGVIVKAAPQDLLLSSANQAPAATGASGSAKLGVAANINFDSRAVAPTGTFDTTIAATANKSNSYNFSTATTIYDTLGNAHTLTIFTAKTQVSAATTAATAAATTATTDAAAATAAAATAAGAAVTAASKAATASTSAAAALADPTNTTKAAQAAADAATASAAQTAATAALATATTAQKAAAAAATAAQTAAAAATAAAAVTPITTEALKAATTAAASANAAYLDASAASSSSSSAVQASIAAVNAANAAVTAAIATPYDATVYGNAVTAYTAAAGNYTAAATTYSSNATATTAATAAGLARTNANPNSEWLVYSSVDGTATANVNGGVPQTVKFDQSGTMIDAPAGGSPLAINLDKVMSDQGKTNISSPTLTFNVDYSESTQFGSAFGTNSLTQDGYTSGRLTGVSVSEDGIISGNYSNGKTRNLGQVALANFTNPNGLTSLGGNQWAETDASGTALVGTPNSGTLGVLKSSTVEESNVDLTAELVNMITEQRAYQASAQTIKTQDQIMNTLVNLR